MKWKTLARRKVLVIVLGTIAVLGYWVVRQRTLNAHSVSNVLANIPPGNSASLTDTAIEKWVARVRQNSKDTDAWVSLGDALMQKSRETMDTAYYARADTVYRKALELDNTNTSAMNGIAWVDGSRHDFDHSVEWAKKVIALDARNHAAYGLLGDAALEMGDYEAAYKDYQQMLDVRPDLSSYSRGAYLLYLTGDARKAIWLMQKAIAAGAPQAENTAWCRAQLALMYWNTGALLPAKQTLEAALLEAPDNYHLLLASGKVKTSTMDYDGAIAAYKKAIAVVPRHEAVVALGDLYTLMGKKDEAEKYYTLVEGIHRLNEANGVGDDLQMARFYADHDRDLAVTLKAAEKQYQKTPNVFAADTLAWAFYKAGRYDDAKTNIQKALLHHTPDANFLFHAGMIFAKLNDRPAAKEYLYQALSLNPNFHPAYASVAADTLKQLGTL